MSASQIYRDDNGYLYACDEYGQTYYCDKYGNAVNPNYPCTGDDARGQVAAYNENGAPIGFKMYEDVTGLHNLTQYGKNRQAEPASSGSKPPSSSSKHKSSKSSSSKHHSSSKHSSKHK
ncbi:hypothetical protein UCREL1_9507 [Eutypa lata UCREL1]|uniref:Uncharacterized protein n=1 Tax=Eutypa lata (strain UCR-EL1) TaxID=1287681 RepID=M7SHC0_EUTLA|nr:hypothetical protein UCREL1_9507 [Eutypa lata UCREL1]